jgi:hypothetical protein
MMLRSSRPRKGRYTVNRCLGKCKRIQVFVEDSRILNPGGETALVTKHCRECGWVRETSVPVNERHRPDYGVRG